MGNQKSLSTKDALKFAKKAEETGDKEKAQKYFEAILTTYPDNEDAVIGIKRLNPNSLFRSDIDELKELFKESKFWEVEVKCRNYLERYPEVQELYSLLGLVMGIKGAHSEALSHFKKAAEITPLNVSVQFNLGNAFKFTGNNKLALQSFMQAINIDPKYVPALSNAGLILMVEKKYDAALELFTAAAHLMPDSVEVLCNVAGALREKGEYEIAIHHYHKAIELDATNAQVFLDMAMCEKLNDNPAEAKNIYELITTEDPLNTDAHNSFGNFLKET
ncbi:MAG: tetratricopeptide repeat protein, partial [Emcibacteraceae bacterium]|nr:tetratricopeptide repeat protein [Emcibacteraceae bacterium]